MMSCYMPGSETIKLDMVLRGSFPIPGLQATLSFPPTFTHHADDKCLRCGHPVVHYKDRLSVGRVDLLFGELERVADKLSSTCRIRFTSPTTHSGTSREQTDVNCDIHTPPNLALS